MKHPELSAVDQWQGFSNKRYALLVVVVDLTSTRMIKSLVTGQAPVTGMIYQVEYIHE